MSSNLLRYGHAPGHLRGAFCALVDPSEWEADEDVNITPWQLTGALWNCTDVMPGDLCGDLDLPRGSSYAVGAREMRARLRAG